MIKLSTNLLEPFMNLLSPKLILSAFTAATIAMSPLSASAQPAPATPPAVSPDAPAPTAQPTEAAAQKKAKKKAKKDKKADKKAKKKTKKKTKAAPVSPAPASSVTQ
jgi:outer membrane biosynthesis protein TonB